MFSWEAQKGRPGEQSIVGKMHCLEKMATKAEPGTKKWKMFFVLFCVFTGAKHSMAELPGKLEVIKETTVPLPFL